MLSRCWPPRGPLAPANTASQQRPTALPCSAVRKNELYYGGERSVPLCMCLPCNDKLAVEPQLSPAPTHGFPSCRVSLIPNGNRSTWAQISSTLWPPSSPNPESTARCLFDERLHSGSRIERVDRAETSPSTPRRWRLVAHTPRRRARHHLMTTRVHRPARAHSCRALSRRCWPRSCSTIWSKS